MKIRENVNISDLVSMRIGGVAKYVIDIELEPELEDAFKFIKEHGNLPFWIMGGGYNTFATDNAFNGVIIRMLTDQKYEPKKDSTNSDEYIFEGSAGLNWNDFAYETACLGFTGCEAMVGIPGTLGAAPVQNIGAYNQDISQTLEYVTVFDTVSLKKFKFSCSELQFGYRRSRFNHGIDVGRYIILTVALRLKKGQIDSTKLYSSLQRYLEENNIAVRDPKTIADAVLAIRNSKLPDPSIIASSGSFFKNIMLMDKEADLAEEKGIPVYRNAISESDSIGGRVHKINTAWLIEQCGLKQYAAHGMKICDTAPLVLINESASGYNDLAAARAEIIQTVEDKYGFTLEQEPVEVHPLLQDLDDDELENDYTNEEE